MSAFAPLSISLRLSLSPEAAREGPLLERNGFGLAVRIEFRRLGSAPQVATDARQPRGGRDNYATGRDAARCDAELEACVKSDEALCVGEGGVADDKRSSSRNISREESKGDADK